MWLLYLRIPLPCNFFRFIVKFDPFQTSVFPFALFILFSFCSLSLFFTAYPLRSMLSSFLNLATLLQSAMFRRLSLYAPLCHAHPDHPMNASFWPFFIRIYFNFLKVLLNVVWFFLCCVLVIFHIRQALFLPVS